MKAFITGIAGFTGKHLRELLESEGIQVTGIDLKKVKGGYQGDLSNKSKLEKILNKEKPDYIFHLASPILRSDKLIDKTLSKNLKVDLFGTVNLFKAISNLRKKPRVLIAGTAAVYKENQGKPFKETDQVEPRTAYGLSKLTQEMVGLQLAKSYGIPLIVSRSILLIGAYQAEGFVVNDLIKKVVEIEMEKTRAILAVGNLNIKRDFTDVRDGVKAYLKLVQKGKPGEIYNVCNNKAVAIKEVVRWLEKNSKAKFRVKLKENWRKNDLKIIQGDNRKLVKLGWKPEYNLEDSFKTILDYWRKVIKA